MQDWLKKICFIFLIPAIVGFLGVGIRRQVKTGITVPDPLMAIVAPAIFTLAAVFAIAGPILYRSFFVHRQRKRVKVPSLVLYQFERNLNGHLGKGR
jgi:hypothetical protein